ncbi:MAG TPA: cytochrome c maturation protein CcmE [Nitrolancea sp.]|nr:cytochrome c maturation protein CcmE [Nitrolancea sp.]
MTGTVTTSPVERKRTPWLNPKLIVVALVIFASIGYLIYNAVASSAASYFVTVSELQAKSAAMDGQHVQVGGNVKTGSIVQGNPGDPISFVLTDGKQTMPVSYSGVLPDIFSDQVQVVVEGTYHADGTFQADTLLTKCPSKFTAATKTSG